MGPGGAAAGPGAGLGPAGSGAGSGAGGRAGALPQALRADTPCPGAPDSAVPCPWLRCGAGPGPGRARSTPGPAALRHGPAGRGPSNSLGTARDSPAHRLGAVSAARMDPSHVEVNGNLH